MRLPHLHLFVRFALLASIGLLGVGATVATAWWSIGRVRVQGPLYREIVLAKDLTADVLPPPAYILESYLVVLQMLGGGPAELDALAATADRLEAEFAARETFWGDNLRGDGIRKALLEDARVAAESFFVLRRERLMPALRAGRLEEGRALAIGEMRTAYAQHRLAIDQVVALATTMVETSEGRATTVLAETRQIMALVVVLSLLTVVVAVVLVARRTAASLRGMAAVAGRIAAGDYAARVEALGSDDEAVLARALNDMGERLGALDQRIRSGIGGNAAAVNAAAKRLGGTSATMSGAAAQSEARAQSAAAGAEEVSANVSTVAASVEEMAATAKEIASQSGEAARVAREGVQVAQEVDGAVRKLGEGSQQIGEIVGTISSIAGQTNLLALNATIEAARAGDAGRGFAVVANEVKELARQSSAAAGDIGQRVAAIQASIEAAVAGVGRLSEIVSRIDQTQQSIAAAIEEQTATTTEVGRNVAEAALGNKEVAAGVAEVAVAAKQTATGSAEVQAAAEELARLGAELDQLVQAR